MKLFPSHPFRWQEPWAFARAKAANSSSGSKPLLLLIFTVLLCIPLLLADLPDNAADVGLIAVFAVAGAFFVVFALIPLASRIPNTVIVARDRIIVGKESVPFSEIEHAVVGTAKIGEQKFPVISIRTRHGFVYLYGLGPKVNPQALADFLSKAGVREPQA